MQQLYTLSIFFISVKSREKFQRKKWKNGQRTKHNHLHPFKINNNKK